MKFRKEKINATSLSISELDPDDIAPEDKEAERKKKISSIVRLALIVVFSAVFIYSSISIIITLVNYKKAEDTYSSLKDEFYGDFTFAADTLKNDTSPLPHPGDDMQSPEPPSGVDSENDTVRLISAKVSALKAVNSDIIGWISIPSTDNIDYPVLRGDDNEFYLNHNYKGGYLPAGSIFADCAASADITENQNLVLYGHNMKNGLMFAGITKYMDEDFFNSGADIYLYTVDGIYVFKVFSAYQTEADSGYIQSAFTSPDEMDKFIAAAASNSKFTPPYTPSSQDTLLTLSTCTNGASDGRYCVVAYLSQTIL